MSRREQVGPKDVLDTAAEPSADDYNLQINLRLRLDEIAGLEEVELRKKPRPAPHRGQLCQLACQIYESRRARDRVLDRKLFGEPAWDMLLALYYMPARGEFLTVTGVTMAGCAAQTTGLRWLRILENQGLVERSPFLADGRKRLMRLTDKGRDLMDRYLTRLYYADVPTPPAYPERAGGRTE